MKRKDLSKFNVTAEDPVEGATDENLQWYVDASVDEITVAKLRKKYTRLAVSLDAGMTLIWATTDPDPTNPDAEYELI